jgi:tetratricopeptide (TPR) repeat protein/tRNA A-37 threonylcarbamoyl transferase component Bud32
VTTPEHVAYAKVTAAWHSRQRARASASIVALVTTGSDLVTLVPPGDETLQAGPVSGDVGRAPRTELARGTVVGRYVVLETLGRGGMGVVYAAFDPELDRKVALKLVGGAVTDGNAGNRLLREAQALAKLDHEHVVTVHDTGRWGEHVFIAMEYLDGGTLGQWMRTGGHGWKDTLGKLLRAGAGLAAAHEAGIVHRDFKPDNVLFGADGRVRVVDFGLARALGHPSEDGPSSSELGKSLDSLDVQLTATGARIGTPAYMSPEQHAGDVVDERSDQFSFCVTAYEAFYGQLPFAGVTLAAIASNVLEGLMREPPKSDVPPWVFALLVRGLQRDPQKRHPSMRALLEALAVDVDGRRRARWRAAAIATAGVAAVGGVWAVGMVGERPCREGPSKLASVWNDDEREAGRAAFGNAGVVGADAAWAAAAASIDAYAAQWIDTYGAACRATRVDGDQSSELLDRRMACLDRRRAQLAGVAALFRDADAKVVERASLVLDELAPIEACSDTEALLSQMAPPDPAIAPRVEAVTTALDEVGTLRAAARFDRARATVEALTEEVEALDYPPVRTHYLYVRSAVASDTGDVESAVGFAYEAIEAAARSRHPTMAADSWISLVLLVGVMRRDFDTVRPILHAAQAAVIAAGSDTMRRARLLASWGTIELLREDYAAAESKLAESYDLFVSLEGPEDFDALEVRQHLALVRHGQGRYDEAEALLTEVLAIVERLRGPEHPAVGEIVGNLARLYKVQGQLDRALPRYEQSLAILTKTVGPNHPVVATTHNSLANTLRILGRYDEAQAHLEKAATIELAQFGPESDAAAGNLHSRALLQEARDRPEEALALAERATAMWERALGEDHGRVAYALTTIGHLLVKLGRSRDAIATLERAVTIREAPDTAPAAERASTHLALARALWDGGGDRTRARAQAERAVALFTDAKRDDDARAAAQWLADHPAQ